MRSEVCIVGAAGSRRQRSDRRARREPAGAPYNRSPLPVPDPPVRRLSDLALDNRSARLGPPFSVPVDAQPLRAPVLVAASPAAAGLLDLDVAELAGAEFLAVMSGASPLPGGAPVAQVYAGHQFGVWVPQLGDGRALLLGEVLNARGERWQLQLKGAGLTPFSRMGDGRAVLRSSIREFLASEAMAALGIPTTRALCVTGSQEPVIRETLETGATLLRLAPSHVRFGSFEYFARNGRHEELKRLLDDTLAAHFPQHLQAGDPALALFTDVVARTAQLIADWQAVGFAHGVMNTDNMSVLGLTLDYGPFAFMDAFDPDFICNHSDHGGRYAFDAQPGVALWNLCRFAEALLPLTDRDGLLEQAQGFETQLGSAYAGRMRRKLGLQHTQDGDRELLARLLNLMESNAADYTRSFRALSQVGDQDDASARPFLDEFADRAAAADWLAQWRARLALEQSDAAARRAQMQAANPKYILRNYLAQRAIEQARGGDFSEVQRLHALLQRPFDEQPGHEAYAALPPDWARDIEISCSS